ncbi:Shikimate dehydrogenase [anaerobic digester metagenome]
MPVYGLIGLTLKHSWSREYFTRKFAAGGIPADYKLYELAHIGDLHALVSSEKQLCGLNVTIPYKQSVIPFLSGISPEAETIGAVNTIRIERRGGNIGMTGFNTDAPAFSAELGRLAFRDDRCALVLGSGGAAMAVAHVLKNEGWNFSMVSRSGKLPGSLAYDKLTPDLMATVKLIVNATPLGMYPDVETAPPLPWDYITHNHLLFDLVYNPEETRFMQMGMAKGAMAINGLGMLKRQAELAWEIWTKDQVQEK